MGKQRDKLVDGIRALADEAAEIEQIHVKAKVPDGASAALMAAARPSKKELEAFRCGMRAGLAGALAIADAQGDGVDISDLSGREDEIVKGCVCAWLNERVEEVVND